MRKLLCLTIVAVIALTFCSCSMYGLDEQEESTTAAAPNIVIIQDTTAPVAEPSSDAAEVVTPSQGEVSTTAPANIPETTSPSADEPTTVAVKTYYTDNPDNKYIVTIADKYGVDRSCLVAFVRANSGTPGATVLQFKGNRDSSGNLITTSEDLLYVYDVQDNGTILKTNRDGSDVEGMPSLAGRTAFSLVEKYIMPDIEKFKRENRLEG